MWYDFDGRESNAAVQFPGCVSPRIGGGAKGLCIVRAWLEMGMHPGSEQRSSVIFFNAIKRCRVCLRHDEPRMTSGMTTDLQHKMMSYRCLRDDSDVLRWIAQQVELTCKQKRDSGQQGRSDDGDEE